MALNRREMTTAEADAMCTLAESGELHNWWDRHDGMAWEDFYCLAEAKVQSTPESILKAMTAIWEKGQ